MTSENSNKPNKLAYIAKAGSRDFVQMAMITIALVSIFVVSNISTEQNSYMIKLQEQENKKNAEQQVQIDKNRAIIRSALDNLDSDLHTMNFTTSQLKTLMERLILFEDKIHNENLIKFQKLDKLIADLSQGINMSKDKHKEIIEILAANNITK
jgi:hypothetical protein